MHSKARLPLLRLFIIGVGVQLAWEAALLIGGIRSESFPLEQKLQTLFVNALLETNLGAVPIFVIFIGVTRRLFEDGRRRTVPLGFSERLIALNACRVSEPLQCPTQTCKAPSAPAQLTECAPQRRSQDAEPPLPPSHP